MTRTTGGVWAPPAARDGELVAYELDQYIDDFTGYVRESFIRSATGCPFHAGGRCTPAHRADDLRRLRGLIDAIRLGGALRHEPYVTGGSGMAHILVVKEHVNGVTYVAGRREDLATRFGGDALSDDSSVAVLHIS